MDKVIIFGAGNTGKRVYGENKGNWDVAAFLDNDRELNGTQIDGIKVLFPDESILTIEFDYIVVASVYGKWEIEKQLKAIGVAEERVKDYQKKPNILPDFLNNLAHDFQTEGIVGACAEVGVFRGVSARMINEAFPKSRLHLFDTFEGFPARDVDDDREVAKAKAGQFSDTSIDIVMEGMPHPENVIIHKGYFPDTARDIDEKFCFVRVDVDLLAPTVAAFEVFTSLMVPGGVMLIHDYFGNQYMGIEKAVREYLDQHSNLHKLPIGDSMSIAIVGF